MPVVYTSVRMLEGPRKRHFAPQCATVCGGLRLLALFRMSKWNRRIGIRVRAFRVVGNTVARVALKRHGELGSCSVTNRLPHRLLCVMDIVACHGLR